MEIFVFIGMVLGVVFCVVWVFFPFLLLSKLETMRRELRREVLDTREQVDRIAAYYGPKNLDAQSANLAELKRCRRALEAMLPQEETEYPDPEPVEEYADPLE